MHFLKFSLLESEEVGVVADDAAGADHVALLGVTQPVGYDIGTDVGGVDFASEEHFGSQRGSFLVVGLFDALDIDVLGIPVVLVLNVDSLLLGLSGLQDVCAVEPHGFVIQSVIGAKLLEEFGRCGPIGTELQNGGEVRTGLFQMIFQSEVVYRYDAQIFRSDGGNFFIAVVGDRIDDAGVVHDVFVIFAFRAYRYGDQFCSRVFQQFGGVYEPAVHQIAVAAVIGGVADIAGCGYVVVCGDGSHLVAVLIVPVLIRSQMEGPGEAVFALFPAFRRAGNDVAVGVIFHEGVDGVGADFQLVGRAAHQVVHGGHFAGIQRAVDLFRCIGAAVRTGTGFRCFSFAAGFRSRLSGIRAGCHGEDHGQCQKDCKDSLCVHTRFSSNLFRPVPFRYTGKGTGPFTQKQTGCSKPIILQYSAEKQ